MEEEDKEFFILVLGVLAAIILVVSWWYTSGGAVVPAQTVAPTEPTEQSEDSDDHAAVDAEEEDDDFALEPAETPAPAETEELADDDEAEPVEERAAPLPATVFDVIAGDNNLSVVTGLLRDEGLDQVLTGDGPFTVFAPSNDAINSAASSDTTLSVLENARGDVLTYHVVQGKYSVDELAEIARGGRSTELLTVQGEPLDLTIDDDDVIINGNAIVAAEAQESDNGVVHTLDNVLIPPVAALNSLVESEPILFASGSATIEQASFPTLDSFIEVLADNNVSVTIEGHTDSSGDAILNQNLSQSRARSVLNYLVANGIEESRLSAEGFGSSKPVADNDSEEGRALNRRIEFTLK